MTMSKEMERLNSMLEFYNNLINALDYMNFISMSNKYNVKIEEYQNKLTDVYKRIQDLKEEENK